MRRYVGNSSTFVTDPSGLEERNRRRGTASDILRDLSGQSPAFKQTVEDRAKSFAPGMSAAETGQRLTADIGGFGVLIDGAEAIGGKNVLKSKPEKLTIGQRVSSGFWAVVGLLPFVDFGDDAAKASRAASLGADTAEVAANVHVVSRGGFGMIQSPVKAYGGELTEAARRIVQMAGTDTCGPACGKRLLFDSGGDKVSQHALNAQMKAFWSKQGVNQAEALAEAMTALSKSSNWKATEMIGHDGGVKFLRELDGNQFEPFIAIIGRRGEHAVIIDKVTDGIAVLRDPADGFTRQVPIDWFYKSFYDVIRRVE